MPVDFPPPPSVPMFKYACEECSRIDQEASYFGWAITAMAAAATGILRPDMKYVGKPQEPIEEILRLRRTAYILAERIALLEMGNTVEPTDTEREFMDALSKATREIPVPKGPG